MSAVVATRRPASPTAVLGLQYGNPNRMIGVPVYILGGVVLLSIVIVGVIRRAGGDDDASDFNASVLWSLLGYTVVLGVQNVSASFPFALALGATRRTFVLGNLLTSLLQALLVALGSVVLLGIEAVTGGWFLGARILGTTLLGAGDPLVLGGIMLLTMLAALSVGSVFGASWVRFGAMGPLLLGVGLVVVGLALLLLVLLPGTPVPAFRPWWLPVAGAAVIGAATVGQYLLLRRAAVR